VRDGTQWILTIRTKTDSHTSYFDNSFPDSIKKFRISCMKHFQIRFSDDSNGSKLPLLHRKASKNAFGMQSFKAKLILHPFRYGTATETLPCG